MNYIEKYNRWLQAEVVDDKTKEELKTLSDKEIEDRFYCDLEFGTGGLRGVVNIVNIFQPEIVCVGGGVSHEGKKILTPVKEMIKNKSFARFGKEQSNVCLATLGNDAGIIGASLLWKSNLK